MTFSLKYVTKMISIETAIIFIANFYCFKLLKAVFIMKISFFTVSFVGFIFMLFNGICFAF
jgi:hypothetical protein